jgi:hypothetical protein
VRAILVILVVAGLLTASARAQSPLELGTPETAFAGGPIRLSRTAAAMLRSHYENDKVPLVPQPYRGKLDAALLAHDWPKLDTLKKELAAAKGIVMALAWEQSRFIATGSPGVAEMHALDVAATGSTGLSETAVMLWFYAAAVTMTDGHQCVDEAARETHLDRLRGPVFEPVTRIVRSISDERLAAMRDLAVRLETVLAPERSDDTVCVNGSGKPEVKSDPGWRGDAAITRAMLPKHLTALAAVMRPRPIARLEPPKQEIERAVGAKPEGPRFAPDRVEPTMFEPAKSLEQGTPPFPPDEPGWSMFEPENAERRLANTEPSKPAEPAPTPASDPKTK